MTREIVGGRVIDGSGRDPIARGMVLDGKTIVDFSFSSTGLDGTSLAFVVVFTDGSAAIYRADAY